MLTLYHGPVSRSSRIIWLLEELGVTDYRIAITDIPRPDGTGAVDPSNPHPDKKVPALIDDDALVTESSAIVLYLTDKFPKAGIGRPVGHPQRGAYVSWLAYYSGVIEPVLNIQFAGLGDNQVLQRTFRNVRAMHERVSGALAAGPWMLGKEFSGVDILIASMGMFVRTFLPAGEVVDAYLARCGARPALARALAKERG